MPAPWLLPQFQTAPQAPQQAPAAPAAVPPQVLRDPPVVAPERDPPVAGQAGAPTRANSPILQQFTDQLANYDAQIAAHQQAIEAYKQPDEFGTSRFMAATPPGTGNLEILMRERERIATQLEGYLAGGDQPRLRNAGDFVYPFLQAGSLNTSDEIAGLISGAWSALRGGSFKEGNEAGTEAMRTRLGDAYEVAPELAIAGSVAGAVPTLALPGGWAARARSTVGKTFRAGVVGGAAGGVAGGAATEGGFPEWYQGAREGAKWGAGIGAASVPLAAAVAAGARGIRNIGTGTANVARRAVGAQPKPAVGAPFRQARADLQDASHAFYDTADAAGVSVTPASVSGLESRLNAVLAREGFDQFSDPPADVAAALARVHQATEAPERSLRQVEALRRFMRDAGKTPEERRLAGLLQEEIEAYMANLSPADVIAGDPAAAMAALEQARTLWAQQARLGVVIRAVQLSSFRAGSSDAALRAEFARIAANENVIRQFSAQDRALIESVARGGTGVQRALKGLLRGVPNFLPVVYGAATQDLLGAGTMGVARNLAETASTNMTMSTVDRLLGNLSGIPAQAPSGAGNAARRVLGALLTSPAVSVDAKGLPLRPELSLRAAGF